LSERSTGVDWSPGNSSNQPFPYVGGGDGGAEGGGGESAEKILALSSAKPFGKNQ